MWKFVADLPSPSCSHLFPRPGIQKSQVLDPDLFWSYARGHAGEPRRPTAARVEGVDSLSAGKAHRHRIVVILWYLSLLGRNIFGICFIHC